MGLLDWQRSTTARESTYRMLGSSYSLLFGPTTAGGRSVTIWLNSPGGDVVAAAQIYNMLIDYPGTVTVNIDGIAASATPSATMTLSRGSARPTKNVSASNEPTPTEPAIPSWTTPTRPGTPSSTTPPSTQTVRSTSSSKTALTSPVQKPHPNKKTSADSSSLKLHRAHSTRTGAHKCHILSRSTCVTSLIQRQDHHSPKPYR